MALAGLRSSSAAAAAAAKTCVGCAADTLVTMPIQSQTHSDNFEIRIQIQIRIPHTDYRLDTADVPVTYYTRAELGDLKDPYKPFKERRQVWGVVVVHVVVLCSCVVQLCSAVYIFVLAAATTRRRAPNRQKKQRPTQTHRRQKPPPQRTTTPTGRARRRVHLQLRRAQQQGAGVRWGGRDPAGLCPSCPG